MITFKEYVDHQYGTYASLKLSKESQDQLHEFISQYIDQPTSKEDLHCTVVYSKTPCPNVESHQPKLPITAKASGYESFDSNAFVLKLESDTLQQFHKETRALGASYDYPEYKPHITLASNHTDTSIPVPNFDLVFDQYHIEELKD